MKELHVLVDFENVQPSLGALAKCVGTVLVWLRALIPDGWGRSSHLNPEISANYL
jgi:hypothetical protein